MWDSGEPWMGGKVGIWILGNEGLSKSGTDYYLQVQPAGQWGRTRIQLRRSSQGQRQRDVSQAAPQEPRRPIPTIYLPTYILPQVPPLDDRERGRQALEGRGFRRGN